MGPDYKGLGESLEGGARTDVGRRTELVGEALGKLCRPVGHSEYRRGSPRQTDEPGPRGCGPPDPLQTSVVRAPERLAGRAHPAQLRLSWHLRKSLALSISHLCLILC